jgi:uncharacterized protein (DUF1778 family)
MSRSDKQINVRVKPEDVEFIKSRLAIEGDSFSSWCLAAIRQRIKKEKEHAISNRPTTRTNQR